MSAPTRTRKAKAYRLVGGPTVVLAELRPHEVVNAWRSAGGGTPTQRAMAASIEALKMAIRQIDGEEVSHADLEVGLKARIPRTRQRFKLAELLGELHTPTAEEVQAAIDSMVVEHDGDREMWRATLPGGREVLLAELDEETVGESLAYAEKEARGAGAQDLLGGIDSLRRSLREVDGAAVTQEQLAGARWDTLFSMRETTLMRSIFSEIHLGGAEEVPLGGERPVSGTP